MQKRYFSENEEDIKKDLRNEIAYKQDQLIRHKLQEVGNKRALEKYENVKNKKSKPYFIWELEYARVFKEKGGFDIVIGNPPYIDSEEMTRSLVKTREYCRSHYLSAKGNWDIFVIFIEKGINMLKNSGTISYIVPNKLIGAKYTEALRKIIVKNTMQEIRDFSNVNVFKEAAVYPIVFRIEKSQKQEDVLFTIMKSKTNTESTINIIPSLFYRDIYWDRYMTSSKKTIDIIEKVLEGQRLEIIAKVNGAATVSEAYVIKEHMCDLVDNDINYDSECVKFINTGTIDRYISLWGEQPTRYIKSSYVQPVINKNSIVQLNENRLKEVNKSKIIVGGMNKHLECYLDEGNYLAGKSTSIIYNSSINLKYLISILNSKLMSFFYSNFFKSLSLQGGYLRIGSPQLKQLPIIIDIDAKIQEILANHVSDLIVAYKNGKNDEIIILTSKIDKMVYELYGLTKEEIEIVEKSYPN